MDTSMLFHLFMPERFTLLFPLMINLWHKASVDGKKIVPFFRDSLFPKRTSYIF